VAAREREVQGTNVEATKTSGGRGGVPVRHKKKLGIVIFLVWVAKF